MFQHFLTSFIAIITCVLCLVLSSPAILFLLSCVVFLCLVLCPILPFSDLSRPVTSCPDVSCPVFGPEQNRTSHVVPVDGRAKIPPVTSFLLVRIPGSTQKKTVRAKDLIWCFCMMKQKRYLLYFLYKS